jgi:hypothetical protein
VLAPPSDLIWVRGKATLDRGNIVLEGKAAEAFVLRSPSLPDELATIHRPGAALEFVRQHGLLYEAGEIQWRDPDEKIARRRLAASTFREPFERWIRTTAAIRTTLLYGGQLLAARDGDQQATQWLKENLPTEFASAWGEDEPPRDIVLRDTSEIVARLLRSNIEKTRGYWALAPRADHGVGLAPVGTTLEGHAWLQLAWDFVTERTLIVCDGCSRVFTPTHGAQRYCSPKCSGRVRARRFTARHRAANSPTKI